MCVYVEDRDPNYMSIEFFFPYFLPRHTQREGKINLFFVLLFYTVSSYIYICIFFSLFFTFFFMVALWFGACRMRVRHVVKIRERFEKGLGVTVVII